MFIINTFYSLLLLLFITLIAVYFYLSREFNYWRTRGVNGDRPIILLGTLWKLFFKSRHELNYESYRKYGKIYGYFYGNRPVLMIADPLLVRDIFIKDFHVFVNKIDLQTGDPFNDRMLTHSNGEEWRKMRSIISPTFSSAKMRRMQPMVAQCCQRLVDSLAKKSPLNDCDLNDLFSDLTMDVIASCAFATRIDVYNERQKNVFVANASKILSRKWRFWMTFVVRVAYRPLQEWLALDFFGQDVKEFFRSFIQTVIAKRMASNVKYNDYLELMINAMNKTQDREEPELKSDENSNELFGTIDSKFLKNNNNLKTSITFDDIVSNSMLFFTAGYETTASLLSHLFYSLAMDEKGCQQRLYEEVMQFDGDYSYETIARMPYLEACVAETLRLYPPALSINRTAQEDYKLGDTGITVPKGMILYVDVYSIHRSAEYYPEPEKWRPERFMPENRDRLTSYTYLPFGLGSRNCVGMTFALMEAKTAVAYLVNRFRFYKTSKTVPELKGKRFSLLLTTDDKYIGMKLRDN